MTDQHRSIEGASKSEALLETREVLRQLRDDIEIISANMNDLFYSFKKQIAALEEKSSQEYWDSKTNKINEADV